MQAYNVPSPETRLDTPVLFLVFNRPEPTRQVFEAIRQAQPPRLYVACDGPRPGRPAEAELCAEVRRLITEGLDWPCELHTFFRDENLGCALNVSAAITWFFEHEPEGIILEDDCLPGPDFFPFCQELLARYRHDTRVMHIGGNNYSREAGLPQPVDGTSYFFSGHVQSWGWASWRRAWQHYDFRFSLLPALRQQQQLAHLYPSWLERTYWLGKFEQMRLSRGRHSLLDTWDYQWHFTIAANSGLTIVPLVNLVQNIGFGPDATHTLSTEDPYHAREAQPLRFPLRHPATVLRDWPRDEQNFHEFLVSRLAYKWRNLTARLPRWLREQSTVPQDPPYPVEAETEPAANARPSVTFSQT
ncbi:nucleotide-diphospho-sugar transferase [Hymenobacter chitinivorans]|uniref:Nucleotide-diphospho-sugar transferase n=1 Tax=Hymenobacter chitinivorans DSM 11115 TaxID=1121954 RepID=A0A2M9BPC0_9BACT|nr:nucleotide-diphospho-sugar transferase [Hymenobacter chitinivorans]PJJ59783.1 hypothetical protein CLV45_1205 [Hymenobacter chitinivorans DSM 11115]